jgi:nucleoside-diphosphate-sugar epimerase
MRSQLAEPVNIGSDEMISIAALAEMIMNIAGKRLSVKTVSGPTGVRGRCSDNRLIEAALGWKPRAPLRAGIERTYRWIEHEVATAMAAQKFPSIKAT